MIVFNRLKLEEVYVGGDKFLVDNHEISVKKPPAVVCLGYFDGVHLGHKRLIDEANDKKRKLNCLSCVHTYYGPPINFIRPEIKYFELTPLLEKQQLLKKYGVDMVLVSAFDEAMMKMSGECFIRDIIMPELDLKHIVVGYDHRFGYKGEMGTAELKKLCDLLDIGLSVVDPVVVDGVAVSSTEIKKQIIKGNISLAEKMLGRSLDLETIRRIQGLK